MHIPEGIHPLSREDNNFIFSKYLCLSMQILLFCIFQKMVGKQAFLKNCKYGNTDTTEKHISAYCIIMQWYVWNEVAILRIQSHMFWK